MMENLTFVSWPIFNQILSYEQIGGSCEIYTNKFWSMEVSFHKNIKSIIGYCAQYYKFLNELLRRAHFLTSFFLFIF